MKWIFIVVYSIFLIKSDLLQVRLHLRLHVYLLFTLLSMEILLRFGNLHQVITKLKLIKVRSSTHFKCSSRWTYTFGSFSPLTSCLYEFVSKNISCTHYGYRDFLLYFIGLSAWLQKWLELRLEIIIYFLNITLFWVRTWTWSFVLRHYLLRIFLNNKFIIFINLNFSLE